MTRGALCGIAAAALYGSAFPLSKHLLNQAISPLILVGLIGLIQGVFFAGLTVVRRPAPERRLRRVDLKWLGISVFSGGLVAPGLYFYGQARVPAFAGALLSPTEILFAAVIAVLWFRERLSARECVGMALILIGAGLVGLRLDQLSGSGLPWIGGLLIVTAFMLWGVDNNATTRIAKRDPFQIMAIKGFVGGAILIAIGLALGHPVPSEAGSLGLIAVLSIGLYGFAMIFFILAMRMVQAARATALFGANPAFGVILAWLALGEDPGAWSFAAGAVILIGVLLLALKPPRTISVRAP